jgi:hypothetical protein
VRPQPEGKEREKRAENAEKCPLGEVDHIQVPLQFEGGKREGIPPLGFRYPPAFGWIFRPDPVVDRFPVFKLEAATAMPWWDLIRVGDEIINLDNVLYIQLDWLDEGEPDAGSKVVIEFIMRGSDELDEGENIAHPYLKFFEGEEGEAIRQYLKKRCPDLLTTEDSGEGRR